MKYYVIELQNAQDGTCAQILTQKDTRLEAESLYHQILASAATSQVYGHGAMMFTSEGIHISHQMYVHEPEPAPEPTPEPESEPEPGEN